jgi:hypothetical protein
MNRFLTLAGIVGAIALGSCVSQQAVQGDTFAWSYQNHPGEGPKLTYGAPASDNVVLMMTCAGGDQATLSLLGGSPDAGLVLTSGGKPTRFAGQPVASPGAGHLIESTAPLNAQPLARFERTGDLTLVDRGRAVEIDARGGERKHVATFFAACRSVQA